MRRFYTLLLLAASITIAVAGCDLFGPDKEGGSGDPDGGSEGDPTVAVHTSA